MSLYLKNMEFFKEKAPSVYEILTKEEALFPVHIEPTADEVHNYVLEGEDSRCFVHSIYDIQGEMQGIFSPLDADIQVLLLFGFGCGYALDFIQDHFPALQHVIVVEPLLPLFKEVLQKVNIISQLQGVKQLTLVLNRDVEEAVGIVTRSIVREHQKKMDLAYHLSYRSLLQGYYERFNTSFIRYLQHSRQGMAARETMKKKWPAHVFQNLGIQHLSAQAVFQRLASRPVLLVTGGGSLAGKIQYVEDMKEQAVVVATGEAIHLLHEEGIDPHFVFSPQLTQETRFFEYSQSHPVPLIYSDHIPSQILSSYWGQKIKVICKSDALSQYIYRQAQIPFYPLREEPSFLNGLVDLFCQSGIQELFFLDLDLSTPEEEEGTPIQVLDIQGREVFTNGGLLRIKRALEEQIAAQDGVEFFCDSQGGLEVQGAKGRSLQEMREALQQKKPLGDFLEEVFKEVEEEAQEYEGDMEMGIEGLQEDLQKVLGKNQKWLKDIKKMRRYRERNLGVQKILKEFRYMESHFESLKEIPFYREVMMKMLGDTFLSIIAASEYQGPDKNRLVEALEKKQTGIAVETEIYGDYLLSLIKDYQEEKELDFDF